MTDQRVEAGSVGATLPLELVEALARVMVALAPAQPTPSTAGETADFLTTGQLASRLGVSRETVRRLAIAGDLPCTVMCQGKRKTTRRYPRRFADDFAKSGQDVSGLAEFARRWRAQMAAMHAAADMAGQAGSRS